MSVGALRNYDGDGRGPLDSKYLVLRAREPALVWRENVIAFVIQLRRGFSKNVALAEISFERVNV